MRMLQLTTETQSIADVTQRKEINITMNFVNDAR
jgi:hypothetical protein